MKLSQLMQSLEQIAPLQLAEPWDNVGLLAGDPQQQIHRILLTIDLTAAVLAEAAAEKCDLIVAYHPPIFQPVKRLLSGSVVFDAIKAGMAIYSPHTAMDAAAGGANDVLADGIGLQNRRPLRTVSADDEADCYKMVTFVPADAVEQVSQAIFDAGAGRIGKYTSCSFQSPGVGTFFGEEGTNPAVGQSGRLERADEIRLETIVPIRGVAAVVQALRDAHPYEEPAFDLQRLAANPDAAKSSLGQGRIGDLPQVPLMEIAARVKKLTGSSQLLMVGDGARPISRAALCAGAGVSLLDEAIVAGAELFLTGEMRHHDVLKAAAAGVAILCTLHSVSERPALAWLAKCLADAGSPPVRISQQDRDPFSIV